MADDMDEMLAELAKADQERRDLAWLVSREMAVSRGLLREIKALGIPDVTERAERHLMYVSVEQDLRALAAFKRWRED